MPRTVKDAVRVVLFQEADAMHGRAPQTGHS